MVSVARRVFSRYKEVMYPPQIRGRCREVMKVAVKFPFRLVLRLFTRPLEGHGSLCRGKSN